MTDQNATAAPAEPLVDHGNGLGVEVPWSRVEARTVPYHDPAEQGQYDAIAARVASQPGISVVPPRTTHETPQHPAGTLQLDFPVSADPSPAPRPSRPSEIVTTYVDSPGRDVYMPERLGSGRIDAGEVIRQKFVADQQVRRATARATWPPAPTRLAAPAAPTPTPALAQAPPAAGWSIPEVDEAEPAELVDVDLLRAASVAGVSPERRQAAAASPLHCQRRIVRWLDRQGGSAKLSDMMGARVPGTATAAEAKANVTALEQRGLVEVERRPWRGGESWRIRLVAVAVPEVVSEPGQ